MEKIVRRAKKAKCNKRQVPKWKKVVNRAKGLNDPRAKRVKRAKRANGLKCQKD